MSDLAQAYVQIIPSADGMKGKLTKLLGGDAEEAGVSSGKVFSNALGGAAKVGVAALASATAAAAAGVTALVKASVSAYADYEQLIGGVETLFGEISKTTDASAQVVQNAGNAYKTAGLSASDYMETATSFAASLMASLEYDGAAAAKAADQAVTDMADNANKMGTSMESIQNAYQGFAKQNYTMLDNLKLGYGGTKEEMQRLLEDAEKLSGQKFDLSSYADIVDAIHVVQKEMGISGITAEEAAEAVKNGSMTQEEAFNAMGTTAKEASTTISGSIAAAKAAWSNLVVGIADDNQNFSKLVNNFVDSVSVAGENVIPRVETAIKGCGQLVEKLLPVVVNEIPKLINDVLPDLLESGVSMVDTLLQGLLQNIDKISEGASEILMTLVDGIVSMLPELGAVAIELIASLANGIGEALPDLIPVAVEAVMGLVTALIENADKLVDGAVALVNGLVNGLINSLPILIDYMPEIVNGIVETLITLAPELLRAAAMIITALAGGLIENLPELVEMIPELMEEVVNAYIDAAPMLMDAGKEFVNSIAQALKDTWNALVRDIPTLVNNLLTAYLNLKNRFNQVGNEFIANIRNAIGSKWDELVRNIPGWVSSLVSGFLGMAANFMEIGRQFIGNIRSGIDATWGNITGSVNGWISDLRSTFLNNVAGFTDIGSNIVSGIRAGIANGWKALEDFAANKAKSLLKHAKNALGIKSPSTLFRDEVGKWIPAGIAVGIDKNSNIVSKAIEKAVTSGIPSVNQDVSATLRRYNTGTYAMSEKDTAAGRNNYPVVNQTFNFGNRVESPADMARAARIEARYGLVKGVPIG